LSLISIFYLTVALVQGPSLPVPLTDIAIERALSQRLDLGVGDTVRLGASPDSLPRLAVVAAIYEPRPDPAEISRRSLRVRLHLPDLAGLLGAPDRVDRLGIGLAPGVPVDSAVAVLNRSAFGFRAHPSAAVASESSQTFKVVSRFHRAAGARGNPAGVVAVGRAVE
jgi:putative ABC transport system permease protein